MHEEIALHGHVGLWHPAADCASLLLSAGDVHERHVGTYARCGREQHGVVCVSRPPRQRHAHLQRTRHHHARHWRGRREVRHHNPNLKVGTLRLRDFPSVSHDGIHIVQALRTITAWALTDMCIGSPEHSRGAEIRWGVWGWGATGICSHAARTGSSPTAPS